MSLKSMIEKVWPPFMSKEDRYYYHLFVKNKKWNSAGPNKDEQARWAVVDEFAGRVRGQTVALKILDVGSGRGWMTNLLRKHGTAEGLEPVESVVRYASRLFPDIRFHAGTLEVFAEQAQKFDLITSSEVLEHVPDQHKPGFVQCLHKLLQPGGHVIISTPRKEILHEIPTEPGQPVEDWLSEEDVSKLFSSNSFEPIERRIISMPYFGQVRDVYQVWLFKSLR